MAPKTAQVRTLIIKTSTGGAPGIRKLAAQMGRLNKSVKSTASSMGFLKNAVVAFGASFGLREIIQGADTFKLLEDRISVFTGSAEKAAEVFGDLQAAAKFTKSSVNGLGESFNRIALATQELGLNTDQILASTVALQQTFRLSGSTLAEATAATIQLTQGLSSGAVRGQELRSVLEANGVIVGLLAKEVGIARGQMIKFGETGKLTSSVVLKVLQKNFDSLNEKAAKLSTTIGQSVTIALDAVRYKIAQLNKEFGIGSKFEEATTFAIDNFETFAQIIITFVSGKYLLTLAQHLSAVGASASFLTTIFSKINLLAAALVAIGLIGREIGESAAKTFAPKTIDEGIKRLEAALVIQQNILKVAEQGESGKTGWLDKFFGNLSDRSGSIKKNIDEINTELLKLQLLKEKGLTEYPVEKKQTTEGVIARIREQQRKQQVKDVEISINKYKKLNAQLKANTISLDKYQMAIRALKLKELNEKFDKGVIEIDDYNRALKKINENMGNTKTIAQGAREGLKKVADEAGNTAAHISSAVVNSFGHLEDTIVEFTKTGELNFKKMTESILDDLTRIIIKASIIKPLAGGILGIAGGSTDGTTTTATTVDGNAKGAAYFGGNVTPFARGGLVSSPTLFGYGGGQTGLMGEAGTEAILPLTRTSGGDLGVKAAGNVTVNVINNSGADVETNETTSSDGERQIDVLIVGKTQEAFAQGRFDKTLSSLYGLNRRGS